LATDFGVDVEFRETTTICIERPAGTGAAAEIHRRVRNPFLATVGLRIDPAEVGAGIAFHLAADVLGTMPGAFFNAVEETVHRTLHQGIHGWQVVDCAVTMTHTGYSPRQSHAHATFDRNMSSTAWDFRTLTPLVLMNALKEAGTTVYGPIHRFHLEMPADAYGPTLAILGQLRAVPGTPTISGTTATLEGQIPAGQIHRLQQQLPELTRGEGVLECTFDSHQPVRGVIPTRPRTDHNPLDRKEYLLRAVKQRLG
jgi:ribosomal protection tetracycline resistance protein